MATKIGLFWLWVAFSVLYAMSTPADAYSCTCTFTLHHPTRTQAGLMFIATFTSLKRMLERRNHASNAWVYFCPERVYEDGHAPDPECAYFHLCTRPSYPRGLSIESLVEEIDIGCTPE